MLIYILIFYFFRSGTSSPVDTPRIQSAPRSHTSLNATSSGPLPICNCNQRSVWDIVWSCVSTLFLCTWVAIHPNVPAPGEKGWKILWRRVKTMYWTFVAPELDILWALRQYLGARVLFKKYKHHEHWTKKHAHFLQMGGFHYSDEVLHPAKLDQLLDNKMIDFPTVSVEEIKDRSKADGLSKAIVTMQTLWFIAQCIGRKVQHLELALLEVTTLAVTACTFVLCILWWDKSFDVRYPIYLNSNTDCDSESVGVEVRSRTKYNVLESSDGCPDAGHPRNNVHAGAGFSSDEAQEEAKRSTRKTVPGTYCRTIKSASAWCITTIQYAFITIVGAFGSVAGAMYNSITDSLQEEGYLATLLSILVNWPIINPIRSFLGPNYEEERLRAPNRTRVSSYFSYIPDDTDAYGVITVLFVLVLPCSTLFGLTHCIAWDFQFPSPVERTLWRISAIVVSTTLWCSSCTTVLGGLCDTYCPIYIYNVMGLILGLIAILEMVVYIPARIYLLVEALMSFRDLPPSVLQDVEWSNFIPHI